MPEIDAEFWHAIRGNIARFDDIEFWWQLCHSEIKPIIQDVDLCNFAIQLMPEGELTADIWPNWSASISQKTGKKGKSLFQPFSSLYTGVKFSLSSNGR